MQTALVIANGIIDNIVELRTLAGAAKTIVAVDGGANYCAKAGIKPDILVGDLDSIKPAVLADCKTAGTEIHRFPSRKDATDLELALDMVLAAKSKTVILAGALGGRWDMSLANVMLVAQDKYKQMAITIVADGSIIHVLHPGKPFTVTGIPGQTVSFLPIKGNVHGLNLSGFEYPLQNHTIHFGSSIGTSNTLESDNGTVLFAEGKLLCTILL